MPYEPIRCPTCSSTKTIVSENGRFFCISCEGWFVWTGQQQTQQAELPHHQYIESMHQELVRLRSLVEQLQGQHGSPKQTGANLPIAPVAAKPHTPFPQFSDAERARQNRLPWFYRTADGIYGPVSFDDVLMLYSKGVIRPATRISNDREKWRLFSDFLADKVATGGVNDLLIFFVLGFIAIVLILALGS